MRTSVAGGANLSPSLDLTIPLAITSDLPCHGAVMLLLRGDRMHT